MVDGDRRFTFRQFDQAVNRLAHALTQRGLVQGDRLALVSYNCWHFGALGFATAKLGVVLVPVNFMLNAGKIAFILGHSEASAVVCEYALGSTVEQAIAEAAVPMRLRGWIPLAGMAAPAGWQDVQQWCEEGGGRTTAPDFDRTDLSSLRKGYYGDSAMPVEVLMELQRRLPQVKLWNFYGQNEMSPLATILGPDDQAERADSAGRAAINVQTMVVDGSGVQAEAGQAGDLGYVTEDGHLYVVDRIKDMIKTGGENVASREVEEVLFEIDGVAEVAVFGIAHHRWVEAVAAAVVPKAGSGTDAEAVHAHAKRRLAGFKRPKYVLLVDSLPKNPSGKILKRELRERYGSLGGAE